MFSTAGSIWPSRSRVTVAVDDREVRGDVAVAAESRADRRVCEPAEPSAERPGQERMMRNAGHGDAESIERLDLGRQASLDSSAASQDREADYRQDTLRRRSAWPG